MSTSHLCRGAWLARLTRSVGRKRHTPLRLVIEQRVGERAERRPLAKRSHRLPF